MKQLKVTTTASATVTLDGLDINDIIKQAADLAHEVLEELSIYGQRNDLDKELAYCIKKIGEIEKAILDLKTNNNE